MNTTYSIEAAVKVLGNLCKQHNLPLSELTAVFPKRPSTEQECADIAKWIGNRIQVANEIAKEAAPSPAPTPQAVLAKAQANWGHKDKNGKNKPQYFAVQMDGKPHFFQVKPGYKSGIWFVEEQASDALYPVRQGERRARILGLIFANEEAARKMYGELISRCSRCNRTLTNHNNPYFPMYGPECGGK
jgi:hypothetical protein